MAAKTIKKCPICGQPTDAERRDYPFCGERCRLIDLGNWASESYVVHRPLNEADEELKSPGSEEKEEP
jgi:uncharacterized protein